MTIINKNGVLAVHASTPNEHLLQEDFQKDLFWSTNHCKVLASRGLNLWQLSCPRISNSSGKPRKRYWTIFSAMDLFIEFQMKTQTANSLIVVKNSCKPGHMKIAFISMMVGTVGEWKPCFTSFTKNIPLVPCNDTIYCLYWEWYLATLGGLSTLQKTHLSEHTSMKPRNWPDNQ